MAFTPLRAKPSGSWKAADLILVPSLGAKKALIQAGIKNPHFAILPSGVNMTRFEKTDPVETGVVYRYLRFPQNEKYVLSVGDYEDNEVLEKFTSVAKALPKIRFYFSGIKRGIGSEALLKKLNRETPENCHFFDLLEDDVFRSAMINASVYLSFPAQEAISSPPSKRWPPRPSHGVWPPARRGCDRRQKERLLRLNERESGENHRKLLRGKTCPDYN
jgi:hypothetical protein